MDEGAFTKDDFVHVRGLLRCRDDAVVRAALSNNLNVILAALDIAAGPSLSLFEWNEIFSMLMRGMSKDGLPIRITEDFRRAFDKLKEQRGLAYYEAKDTPANEA